MGRIAITYLATLIVFCALDFVWLGYIAKAFYQSQIGDLLLAKPNWTAATIFYLAYPVGIVLFGTLPALEAIAWTKALLLGALIGLLAYGTYDLSNLATLKGWTTNFVIVDILWGTSATAIAAVSGYAVGQTLGAAA